VSSRGDAESPAGPVDLYCRIWTWSLQCGASALVSQIMLPRPWPGISGPTSVATDC